METLRRLRARGTVRIEADNDGITVNWWPRGQAGNPFCGRGVSGVELVSLLVDLEQATRPPSRDWDEARKWREWEERRRREARQRADLREADRADRYRERWDPARCRALRAAR